MVRVAWAGGGFKGDHDVSGLNSGLRGGAGFLDIVDHDGGVVRKLLLVDKAVGCDSVNICRLRMSRRDWVSNSGISSCVVCLVRSTRWR